MSYLPSFSKLRLCALLCFTGALSPLAAMAEELVPPLFGLHTAPNGEILVASSGAGIVSLTGRGGGDIALPLVTDVHALGRGSFWATRTGTDPRADTGQALLRVSNGHVTEVVNLFEYEALNDPDNGPNGPDSNPFDVHALNGRQALVADAGANTLMRIDNQGSIELLALLPDEIVPTDHIKSLFGGCPSEANPFCGLPPAIPAQAVATSVAVGPDGYYYVGELKGFPAPVNESRVWRIAPTANQAQCGASPDCTVVFDGGFTSIIDLAFGPDGTLYVVELDENTWAAVEFNAGAIGGTVNACDIDSLQCHTVASDLPIVTAMTLGKGGGIWVTENALIPGLAGVRQIQ